MTGKSIGVDGDIVSALEWVLDITRQAHEQGTRVFMKEDLLPIMREERMVQGQCDLVRLENLNLCGGLKSVIMDYIAEKHSEFMPLYKGICKKNGK